MGRSEYTIEVKALADTEGAFKGALSVYGNVDDVGDVVEHGAFDETLAVRKHFPLLWQHDATQPIGSFDVVSSDGDSLVIDGKFNMDVAKAREAYALLKREDINGLSIGYVADDYKYDSEGIRHLLKVTLHEGSLVTFPANRLATAQAKQRLSTMERKSRYAGCKFLEKMTEEERLAALEELEALDKATKSEDADEEVVEEIIEDEAEDEKAKKEQPEDIDEILDAIKECTDEIDRLKE